MTELEASGVGEPPPPYIIFVVVSLFFLTGLLGFLICHLLKKKGYRCRAGDLDDDEEEGEKLGGGADDEYEENQDTVEQILKCIIENEANMEAFNEMLGNKNVCVRHDPRLRKESIAGVPPHHHTVHSGVDHNSCHLCAQVRTKKDRRHSRTPRFKQRPGEQTVFAVGRFRVTHTDKKPQGGPNPLAASGDQLDQSQDSEDRKESGYNLRSMFKDVQPPSENANVGKRRRSLTLFGLRRGSDPVGVKEVEGMGRDTGGFKLALQQQPAVLEEPAQTDGAGADPSHGAPKTEAERSTSPRPEAGPSGSVDSKSPRGKKQASMEGVGLPSSPDSGPKIVTTTSVPGLPLERRIEFDNNVLKSDGAYDPGPLQTSTPIAPLTGSIAGMPLIPTAQKESHPGVDFPVIQTPPDPGASPDPEPGASLLLMSLGSSPASSLQGKTLSSVSSLRSPSSPPVVTPSPKLTSRELTPESPRTALSPALTPSPKLPSGRETPEQPRTSSPRFGQTPEGVAVPQKETKRAGILKKPKRPAPSSLPDQLSEDALSALRLAPRSPSSLQECNMGPTAIVKASPDSRREFSVVTMTEGKAASPPPPPPPPSEPEGESEKGDKTPAAVQAEEASASGPGQPGSTDRAEGQEKEDMMEMEDIRDCRVTRDTDAEMEEEGGEKASRSNQD